MAPWDDPMTKTRENFWNLSLQVAAKCILLNFYWKFRVSWGSFEESLTRKIDRSFSYTCLNISKSKSKSNRWIKWKIFQSCFKNKEQMKRMGFITQLKIEFLLPFASCKKLVGKMLALVDNKLRFFNQFLLFILLIIVYPPISNGVIELCPKLFIMGNWEIG